MISRIEALNFRSLRYVNQNLNAFHILVGPNASGKTTFLDVISFLSQLVSNGLDSTIRERVGNFKDLLWLGRGDQFQLAVEAKIPQHIFPKPDPDQRNYDTLRYELAIGLDESTQQISIFEERVILKKAKASPNVQPTLFPNAIETIASLISKGEKNSLTVVNKVRDGNDYFRTEFLQEQGRSWQYAFKLGAQRSALGNLPADEAQFPATTWLRALLVEGVQEFVLNSLLIRKPCPPGQGLRFKPDGSNLPWVIEDLRKKDVTRFANWIAHLQTALPDIEDIRTIEREDDRHRYLVIKYQNGLELPSWVVSDGTLRLLALTLPAYLPDLKGIYLIEEPENGIHPKAVETVFHSLSSVYDAQILLATHSPVLLSIANIDQVLCFAKTAYGETSIVIGNLHPALKDWKGEIDLGMLLAAGVLG